MVGVDMWTPIQQTGYFFKLIEEKPNFYYIGATDYRNCWSTYTSSNNFLYELKKSNDGTDFEDEAELLKRGLDMLHNPMTLKKISISQEDRGQLLIISMTKVYEFPIKLELRLLEASREHFFKTITQPLLQTVCDLRSSQYELRELLKKKDREIDDWRTDGRVPRRDKTNVYDDERHMKKHGTFEQNFGAAVPDILSALAESGTSECKIKPHPKLIEEMAAQNGINASESKEIDTTGNNVPVHVKTERCESTSRIPNTNQNMVSPKLEKISQSFLEEENSTQNDDATLIDNNSQSSSLSNISRVVSPKIEKTSQNSLIEEMPNVEPLQEVSIPKPVVQSPQKTIKTESTPPRKRPKNRLNY